MIAYKVLTHDFRPPIQGGDPVLPAGVTFPYQLPMVEADASDAECGAGWNACANIETAIRIAGEWPDGRPSKVFELRSVRGSQPLIRGEKIRAATWDVGGFVQADTLHAARERLYRPMAGEGLEVGDIVAEVEAWSTALSRPQRDAAAVEEALGGALRIRGLGWGLRQFGDAWGAWNARDARDARDAWGARAAWAAWAAWDAWGARDAWNAWDAWGAWGARAAWNAWDAWGARDARDALTVFVAGRRGWTRQDPALLTTGLRGAYAAGLSIAIPTGPDELGWAMVGG